ncbi:MAG: flippase, partial [Patescibacteria group bacterium]
MAQLLKTIARNTIFQIAGKIISTTLGVLITILLTRYLGPEGYGQYTFVLVFITMFGVIGDWGFSLITIREASRNLEEAGKIIGNVLVIRLILAVVAMAAAIIAVHLLPYSENIRLLVTIGSIYLLAISVKTSFQIVFNVKLKMENWAVSEIAANSLALTLIIILIVNKASLWEILLAFNAGHLVAAVVAGYLALRLLPIKFSLIIPSTKYLLKECLPMGAILVLFTVYNRMDTLILAYYHGDTAVGIYGAAYRIFEVLVLGAAYFANSLLPEISKLAVDNKPALKKLFFKSLIILLGMGFFVAIINFIFAPIGIAIIGGEKFAASVTPLRILSLALIVSYFNHLGGFTLIALGKQW